MNTRALAYISLKLLGLYCFFQFLFRLPESLTQLVVLLQAHQGFGYTGQIGPLVVAGAIVVFGVAGQLVLSISLYVGAEALSRNMVPNEGEMAWGTPDGSESTTRAVFQFLGVYAILHWVPELVEVLAQALQYHAVNKAFVTLHDNPFLFHHSRLISPILGTLIGIFLIFRPHELMRLIRMARPMADVKGEKEG